MAAANATRPIVPVNGGVRTVNVLMNLGVADYNGLQTQVTYRGNSRMYRGLSYTLSKATNTTEPDGNGIGPNDANIARLGEEERGPSVLDQRHRAVIMFTYQLPYDFTAGTVTQLASARPFNSVTGVDNNGDGANNDRPVVDGMVIAQVAVPRHRHAGRVAVHREARQVRRAARSCCGSRASTCSITATSSAARRRSTATPGRIRRSVSWWPSARRPTRSRRSPTSIRRGCSSSRCASSSSVDLVLTDSTSW